MLKSALSTLPFVMQVPIQKMPPSRPAPASSHVPSGTASQRPANTQSSGQPSKGRKRAKQAAGAGTVLLALFSFVVFLGPLGPMAGPRLSGSAPALGHLHSAGSLPGSESMGGHIGSGRVLMAIGTNTSDAQEAPPPLQDNHTALALPVDDPLFSSEEAVSIAEDTGAGIVGVNFSAPGMGEVVKSAHSAAFKSLVLRPSNKKAEVQALQRLKVLSTLRHCQQHARRWSMYCGNSLKIGLCFNCNIAPASGVRASYSCITFPAVECCTALCPHRQAPAYSARCCSAGFA